MSSWSSMEKNFSLTREARSLDLAAAFGGR